MNRLGPQIGGLLTNFGISLQSIVDRRRTASSWKREAGSRRTKKHVHEKSIITSSYSSDSVVSQLPTTVCTRGMSSLTTGSRYDTMLSTTLLVLAPGKPKTEAVRGHLKASSLQRPASSATTVTSPVTTAATRLACIHVGLAAAMPQNSSTARLTVQYSLRSCLLSYSASFCRAK